MRVPSGENAARQTISLWPLSTAIGWPVAVSQTRAVLSAEAVTTRAPSGENAALMNAPVVALEHGDRLARRRVPDARRLVRRTR